MSFLQTSDSLSPTNPTNGSWWIVQVLSTNIRLFVSHESHQRQLVDRSSPFYKHPTFCLPRIPPTAVGGSFKSFLQNRRPLNWRNPTNGSWWIIHVLPTSTEKNSS